jgi:hypothetical protein
MKRFVKFVSSNLTGGLLASLSIQRSTEKSSVGSNWVRFQRFISGTSRQQNWVRFENVSILITDFRPLARSPARGGPENVTF